MPLIQSVQTRLFVLNNATANAAVMTGPGPTQLTFVPPLPVPPGQVLASISSPVNDLFITPGPEGVGNVIWGDEQFLWLIDINANNTGIITNPLTSLSFCQNLQVVPNIPLVPPAEDPLPNLQFDFD